MLSAIVQKVTGEKASGLFISTTVPSTGHRQCEVAGKPARNQLRRLGTIPQNRRPCQDGTTLPAKRKVEWPASTVEEWIAETSARANGANGQYILVIPEKRRRYCRYSTYRRHAG